MSEIVTRAVVDRVEDYIAAELHAVAQYENRAPLDESGIYALHSLAAAVYAAGYADGRNVALRQCDAQAKRERDRSRDVSGRAALDDTR